MKEALLIVLDSVGVGHAPDAAAFGDEGADTLGHIRAAVPGLALPALDAAGLAAAADLAAGRAPQGTPALSWGCLSPESAGKDTTTGHWEIAGAPVRAPFAVFERFPEGMVRELEALCGVTFLGNLAASGTAVIEDLGAEHLRTGRPILYTSADSVMQIAAHEAVVPRERLYGICRLCRGVADRHRIGRVIARPFEGEPGSFRRTAGRKDFSLEPPPTVLDRLSGAGVETVGVGKIGDIFAGRGLERSLPTGGNEEGCATMDRVLSAPPQRPRLVFANLVDFDMLYGHRRDAAGYAAALERFDAWFGGLLPRLGGDTLLVVTADHGNDPTWRGTDHTRERVPLLALEPGSPRPLGVRGSFADIAASLAQWFGVPRDGLAGESFL